MNHRVNNMVPAACCTRVDRNETWCYVLQRSLNCRRTWRRL